MPSEKVTRILISKAGLPVHEIETLSETEAWRRVYALPKAERDERLQVCFTGFGPDEKAELASRAALKGLRVVKSVTKGLGLLVRGPEPGPAKLEKAHAQSVTVLDADDFEVFLAGIRD